MLIGLFAFAAAHAAALTCKTAHAELGPHLQLFEDAGGRLDVDEVAALPAARFAPGAARLDWDMSRSAFWMRFELDNPLARPCMRWLSIGQPRLEDIRVHIRRGATWQVQRAGSAYPLEDWVSVERQPLFPLALEPGERVEVLVRVSSHTLLILYPQLWSQAGLLRERQRVNLVEGISLGIVLLVVPFSLIVGWIMRSRLLAMHAGAVLSYIAMTCALNGYLIYWPGAVPWTREITALLSVVSFFFFCGYARVLYRVRLLPRQWGWLYGLLPAVFGAFNLWALWGDHVQGRHLALLMLGACIYLVLPLTLWAAWRRRLALTWMAWAVVGLFLAQFLARYALQAEQVPLQARQERYSLLSTLPGVLLLVCTLVMEFSRARTREKRALDDLDRQRQAEQERLEKTVALRTEQLRESLRARSSLMARISHDLRSPLVSIIDYARLLQAVPDREYPRKIERNARQQLELIDELLEFSRSELEQLELILAPGYLYGFLRELTEEGAFLAARQGNRFESRFAEDLPALVRADFRRLRQVLVNLLTNAAKFTHEGCITFVVGARQGPLEKTVELRFDVLDTGIGIDPGERELLLQPFRRGHNAGRRDGSGLGLSIVTQLLQHMGSRLDVDAREEGGSRFGFSLILECAAEHDMDFDLVESHPARVDGAGLGILLVDDVEQNLDWLGDLLTGYGFDVERAADGQAALARLEAARVDLVVTDQMMAGMDGWQLLQRVRAEWPGLPVVLYSAAPPRRPAGVPASLDFDAVLLKPASSGDLLACIAQTLHGVSAKAARALEAR
ncbi:hybrid sensor histidine kinase/response regulator [Pseudomonas alcaligenes]|uniref:hybrid sensor histidine kinase/response regulator n=1 Tax=Pseudomonas sp. RIT-PI-AD TaxID=3035294 RepID=UPI0021D8F63D